ncbi:polysaccharide deacetylase family protein [Microbacterium trichothecenolyticum]|uniref:Peptidoglycan-N-acetylglucosamine deacetylase n=1 Tax=Microbacterium trichothecenolyticum TaxID=69370 RepID=A0A0M2HGA7_MICTR|nr:polysaccharide deacetylase family protein [Microbacterium trichothecenolyticum]KJL43797.1 Peptidoglycan-N-acetylglucosamine deacetylase [Microbacterium trichothecenolyticum]
MMVNLCFHGLGVCEREREPGEARYWMKEDVFLGVLDAVADRADVALSFDDGNRSDAEIALPALRERGLTATFFVLAGRLDDPASLDAADLRALRAEGMSIGSHGWSHIPWRGLTSADAKREFIDARSALEGASGAKISEAAFPLGRYDRSALRRLKAAGYRTVFTSDRFPARKSSWLQARYSVTADDTVESVSRIARGRPGLHEARNVLASAVKRVR